MASKGQLTGMAGVYYAAAILSKMGFIVTPTSRNTQGIDLLIANAIGTRVYSAQVKTNASTFAYWLLSKKNEFLCSQSLFYIFVNLKKSSNDYYIVPSAIVAKNIKTYQSKTSKTGKVSTWYSFYREDAEKYKDQWLEFLGDPAIP